MWKLNGKRDRDAEFQPCPECKSVSLGAMCKSCKHNRKTIEELSGEVLIVKGVADLKDDTREKRDARTRTPREIEVELDEWKSRMDRAFIAVRSEWTRLAEDEEYQPPKDWIYKLLDDKFTALRGPHTCERAYLGLSHKFKECIDCQLADHEAAILMHLEAAEELA